MSKFEPVFLDEALGERISMTMLKHFNSCPRAGFLYAKHRRDGVQTIPMARGSAVHAIKERSTRAMLEADERMIPAEIVKAVVVEVLLEFAVPIEEHDYIRELSHRWAGEWQLFEDEKTIGLETLFVLEVAGWMVRCKVDYASVKLDESKHVHVDDYKSGRGVPAYDEVSRKRRDGSIAAKNLQLIVYMLAVVFGRPVELVVCGECGGTSALDGFHPGGDPALVCGGPCPACNGRGRLEVIGEQVARGCEEASADFVFPGVEDKSGLMMRRSVSLTRLEMLEYLESLETIVKRVARAEQTGDWPAVVGAGCAECPCSLECPIPTELRDHAGTINTPEQAREALQLRAVRQMQDRALGRELRNFVKSLPGSRLTYGEDQVAEFAARESTEVKDKPGMYEAIAAGMSVEDAKAKFERVSKGTTFVERELSSDEIEGV